MWGGLVRWNRQDGSFVKYTTTEGLPSNRVNDLAVDEAGQLWVGTSHSGLSKFDGQNWQTYLVNGSAVSSIALAPNGHLWFNGHGASEFYDGQIRHVYTSTAGLAGDSVAGLTIDPAGQVWASFYQPGVSSFDGLTWTTYPEFNYQVNDLAVSAEGEVWVATPAGVGRFNGQHWITYTKEKGLAPGAYTAIATDAAGRTWVGTLYDGVSVFDGRTWRTYTTQDGLASNEIKDMAVDPTGRVWVGTYEDGVSMFDGQRWVTYTEADGLADNTLNAITIDTAGHPWFGTYVGVSEFILPASP